MRCWCVSLLIFAVTGWAQGPVELVRRSIAQDQLDWVRMQDYTWHGHSVERHFDSHGKVESTKSEGWETVVLDGQPFRRDVERDGKPLSPQEQQKQQQKLDHETAHIGKETPEQRQRRVADAEKQRKREFAFLSEIPDLYDLKLEGDAVIDGRPVWIVSGAPRPGAQPRTHDAKVLLKVRGRLWIDKATYQWAKVEAETTGTISWGLFLARLNPGAKLVFEQGEVNSEIWLPKRLFVYGSGRLGLVKRLTQDQVVEWSDYKKFSVDSKVVTQYPIPKN